MPDPVTETDSVTNRGSVTDTTVADGEAATGPPQPAQDRRAARPAISQLFIYDRSVGADNARALRDAYYGNADIVEVTSWSDLKAALSRYSTIETLVLDTHSAPGDLIIGGHNPARSQQKADLAATGVQVTGMIIFEGCRIMGDPVAVAEMVSGIDGPNMRACGYTLWSLIQPLVLNLTGEESEQTISDVLDPHRRYLLPNSPTAAELVGQSGDVTVHKRWFRDQRQLEPSPTAPVGSLPPRGFWARDDMDRLVVSNRREADELRSDYQSPVNPAKFVTITDVDTVRTPVSAGARP